MQRCGVEGVYRQEQTEPPSLAISVLKHWLTQLPTPVVERAAFPPGAPAAEGLARLPSLNRAVAMAMIGLARLSLDVSETSAVGLQPHQRLWRQQSVRAMHPQPAT